MPPIRARGGLRQRRGGCRHNGQTRMNEAIFIFALSAVAALVEVSSPNVLAGHHSKAMDIFIFSVLASFCATIISMTLPRRRRPRIVRASGRLAAFSAAVAFSSVTSMVLPRGVWWAAYLACALPLFNLLPRPFVLCFEFLRSSFCWLKQMIADLCHGMQRRMKASRQTQTQGVEIMVEV
ncbi:hypothetical protein ACLOJK_009632 [Asimina triloba]